MLGDAYALFRQPDPRIAAVIATALGDAGTLLNVGAGTGSYEPADRQVTAVEPSASMRAKRPARLSVAIDAVAENLPFAEAQFGASMAIFTVHQWSDLRAGLAEMRRVTSGPVLVLTCDPDALNRFWLAEYAPAVIAPEARRYPAMSTIVAALGAGTEIVPVGIPLDCTDGFNEAYFGRPEMLLDDRARSACSAWSFLDLASTERFEVDLRRDLADGTWDARFGALRTQPVFDGSLRLLVGRP